MKQFIKLVGGLILTGLLAACGGGGGSAGGTPGGGGSATTGPTLVVTILDQAGATANSISVGGAFVARATVRDAAGALVAGKTVTFDLNGASIATLSPTTALTNASGVAQVAIAPTSIASVGAATLSASALVVGTTATTGNADFSVTAASLSLSTITAGSLNLPSGGNTSLAITALVGGVPSTGVPVNVTYSASCGRINGSLLPGGVSVTTNGSGIAPATYSAVASDGSLCSGVITISASSAGATSQSILLTVAAPIASAVTFVSAVPAQIFIAGSGAAEQSVVRFRVLSSAGTPMPNESVTFSLQTNPAGVGIGSSGLLTPVTVTTDSSGIASVSVFSGTSPGPVRLRAALTANSAIFAESQNLTVASGPPSQRFMSLSVETFNIEGWNKDGVSTVLTARIADRQGNAVTNGTVINFTTEGGQVASNCATTAVGNISSCSVNFVSQNNRPADGRVSVLAYTEGTKDYVDSNSSNSFDAGDNLIQLGDAYRDDNEDGVFNAANDGFRISRNVSGAACTSQGAPFPSITGTCDNLLATTVREQATIMFSSSSPVLSAPVLTDDVDGNPISLVFTMGSFDHPLLPMPAGTIIEATAVDTTAGNGVTCAVTFGPTGTPLPNISPGTNPSASLATSHEVNLKDCRAGDRLVIDVTVPSKLKTPIPFTLP
jgi:Bacterial Ig-like domain (group 1)